MFADLTDVRSYYELLGGSDGDGGGDPLILIPGLGCTSSLFDPVAADLAKHFSLVLFDNRGLGRSVAKRQPQSLKDYAADVIELMDYLQLDRAHVLGLSFGGIVAQQVAVDHPGRVDRLVLISCANRFGPYLVEIAKLLGQSLRRFPPELFRRTVELLGVSPLYLDAHAEELNRKIADACAANIPRMAVGRQLRCLGNQDVACEADYQIAAPTLVVAGDQDMLIPACYARRMAREIPGAEFVLLRDCGHNLLLERPEFMIERITEFLTRSTAAQRTPRFQSDGAGDEGLHTEEVSFNA